ncbi:MAG: hypothetical protein WD534_10570, partial [Phycisphaeraceae bacterium]
LRVDQVQAKTDQPLGVRDKLPLTATVYLGELQPDEVRVQAYTGGLDSDGRIVDGHAVDLQHAKDLGHGKHRFTGEIGAVNSGRYGFAIRIVPGGPVFDAIPEPGLIHWEGVRSKPVPETVIAEAEQAAT